MIATRKVANKIILTSAGIVPYSYEFYDSICFNDFDEIKNNYCINYKNYARAGFELGLFTGDANGNFNPNAILSRAEFCAIIKRLMTEIDLSSYAPPAPFDKIEFKLLKDATVRDSVRVLNDLSYIPKELIEVFNSESWHISITSEQNLNDYYSCDSGAVVGLTYYSCREILLPVTALSKTVCHEFGHFVQSKYHCSSSLLQTAFLSESADFSEYATTSTDEYFAEMFANYMMFGDSSNYNFEEKHPLSYAIINDCLQTLLGSECER